MSGPDSQCIVQSISSCTPWDSKLEEYWRTMFRSLLKVTWPEGTGDVFSPVFPDCAGPTVCLTLFSIMKRLESQTWPHWTLLQLEFWIQDSSSQWEAREREIHEDDTRPPMRCMTTAVSKAIQAHCASHSKGTLYHPNSWETWNLLHLPQFWRCLCRCLHSVWNCSRSLDLILLSLVAF